MQERNQFSESIPVDDTTFRLTHGDWTDWTQDVENDVVPISEENDPKTGGYESEIVEI